MSHLDDAIDSIDLTALHQLQQTCHLGSRSKGFHDEGDDLRTPFTPDTPGAITEWDQGDVRALRNHYANKMMLIVGEVSEAHEQLRTGRAMDETYYPTKGQVYINESAPSGPFKPEGIPSELADVVIRVFDLAAEAGIDLPAMIAEKLRYNATRPAMHGKKF